MIDLKPYFDAVNAAEAEVQRVAHQLDELFRQETDEAKAQALAIQPELEKAQAKHAAAVSLYEQMQKANSPNDIAKNFIPVSTTSPDDAEGHQPSVIKRQEYDRLSLVDRARFVRSGGILQD